VLCVWGPVSAFCHAHLHTGLRTLLVLCRAAARRCMQHSNVRLHKGWEISPSNSYAKRWAQSCAASTVIQHVKISETGSYMSRNLSIHRLGCTVQPSHRTTAPTRVAVAACMSAWLRFAALSPPVPFCSLPNHSQLYHGSFELSGAHYLIRSFLRPRSTWQTIGANMTENLKIRPLRRSETSAVKQPS
jgi:hypothetical protein